jgi:phage recombination protein Bet
MAEVKKNLPATAAQNADVPISKKVSILAKLAAKYSVDPHAMADSLKQVAFRQKDGVVVSDAQMVALLIVADQYGLNPFTKEIYAYPDKNNGIVPVVGVDGWNRIANDHPQFDGEEIEFSENMIQIEEGAKPCPEWLRVSVYRKDRKHPTVHTEHLDECYRKAFKKAGGDYTISGPWQTHTKRMLEHKARIQARRIAFGFGGIYDDDEAQRIIDAEVVETKPYGGKTAPKIMPRALEQAATTQPFAPAEVKPEAAKNIREEINEAAEFLGMTPDAVDTMIDAELGVKTLLDVKPEDLPKVLELLRGRK